MTGVFEGFTDRLILASSSPRRKELLAHLGHPFEVLVPAVEEKAREGEAPAAYAVRNAREKAACVLAMLPPDLDAVVIGADTIGVLDGEILEKPVDAADAARMLRAMAGRRHEVLSGIALARLAPEGVRVVHDLVATRVLFKALTEREIAYYVASGEALDKAGAYGIQGKGGFMVEAIEGSYSNVVGLPLVELAALIKGFQRSPSS